MKKVCIIFCIFLNCIIYAGKAKSTLDRLSRLFHKKELHSALHAEKNTPEKDIVP